MVSRTVTAVLALLLAGGAVAQIYKWVDEDGVVHYSDQPVDGAEEVRFVDTRPAPRTAPGTSDGRSPDGGGTAASAAATESTAANQRFSYESLSFAGLAPEQTLWNIQGTLTVTLNLQPGLRRGDSVRVYLDGEAQDIAGMQVQLTEVWRGEHTLQAEVLSSSGALMIRSEPLRFFVQQTSVQN